MAVDVERADKLERLYSLYKEKGDKEGQLKALRAMKSMQDEVMNPAQAQTSPVSESGMENFLAGTGKAFTDLALGAKQIMVPSLSPDEEAFLRRERGDAAVDEMIAGFAQERQALQQQAEEKAALDAPLMGTKAGIAGNITGNVAAAIPTAFIPGANTAIGATLTGGALGAAQPTATEEQRSENLKSGAAFGLAGYGVGKGLGEIGKAYSKAKAAQRAAANSTGSIKAATAKSGQQAGYVIPPTQINPTRINRALEGLAGKLTTAQSASIKNQAVTNRLVARALGVSDDAPITPDLLSGIRRQAGDAYEAIRGAGLIKADTQYADDLAGITKTFRGAARDFPELAKTDIADIVESINKSSFDADSAIDAIKILRDKADTAYRQGDKALGASYKEMSGAIEGVIERNLKSAGKNAADLLKDFRESRQLIAKTYSIQSALNESTGHVNARKLASQLAKGKPLSGELKQIASFAQAFPEAAKETTSSMPGLSPLDYATALFGVSASGGKPLYGSGLLLRPAVRNMLLSGPYQALAAQAPKTTPGLMELLAPQLQKAEPLLRIGAPSVYAAQQ